MVPGTLYDTRSSLRRRKFHFNRKVDEGVCTRDPFSYLIRNLVTIAALRDTLKMNSHCARGIVSRNSSRFHAEIKNEGYPACMPDKLFVEDRIMTF